MYILPGIYGYLSKYSGGLPFEIDSGELFRFAQYQCTTRKDQSVSPAPQEKTDEGSPCN